jgi:hypothetical protein
MQHLRGTTYLERSGYTHPGMKSSFPLVARYAFATSTFKPYLISVNQTSALVTFYIPDYALETCTLVFPVVYPTHTITSGYDSSAGVGGRAGPLRRDGGHSKKEPVMLTRPDYMNSTTSANINSQSVLEVSVLASPNTLRDRKRSSPISLRPVFGKDGNVTSASFACKSQSRVSLQITCPGDCRWEFGLQGMTIQSSSTKSLAKTGFHLQQYEGIECVK